MKSNLPTTFIGFCCAAIFIPVFFFLYYAFAYEEVSEKYQGKLWSSSQFSDNEEKVDIRVNIPKTISDFVDSEIRVQSWNRSVNDKELNLVVSANIYDKSFSGTQGRKKCNTIQVDQPFVYISTQPSFDQKKSNSVGKSSVILNVPAYGSSNVSLWISMQPDTHIQEKSCVVLRFFRVFPLQEGSKVPDSCESGGKNFICPIKFDDYPSGNFVVVFNKQEVMIQSILSILLLPPWSNIVLPSAVLLFISFFEKLIFHLNENKRKYYLFYEEIKESVGRKKKVG